MATMAPPLTEERFNSGFVGLIVLVATIGGLMFGYDSGVINGTQPGLKAAFNLSEGMVGLVVASLLVGCAVGAFAAGRLSDRLGRRGVMRIGAILFLVSALGAGAAPDAGSFVLARLLGGLGVGAASVLSPVYISEVTPAHIRGRLTSIQQIMIIGGLTAAFLANYALAGAAGSSLAPLWGGHAAWRWMFWMQAVPAAVYLVALLFIPESPRFLVVRGREAEAEGVLAKLFGHGVAAAKVQEIRASLAGDHHKPKLSDLRDKATGRVRPIIWAGIMLAVFQQFVGINIVFYYGAVLWQAVGFTEAQSLLTNILSGAVSIAGCLFCVFTVDKIGRKPLLLLGSAAMAVTLGLETYAFSTGSLVGGTLQLPGGMGQLAFISALIYSAMFNLSWGPIMWVMLGEMFPTQIRGSALAVAGFAQWIANFVISMSFPWLKDHVGLAPTYGFYAASAFVSFFLVKALIHETRGRELEAMVG
jgi:SP family sugar:H+ symporter-like MFS transporter